MAYATLDLYTPGHLAIENIIATCNWLQHELDKSLAPYQITLSQFKVLRILQEAHPTCLTCSQIGDRLIDRTPDVTRLLDRLERAGYIFRKRADHDRRIVEVHLSEKGKKLLSEANSPLELTIDRLAGILNTSEHLLLTNYLERFRREPL